MTISVKQFIETYHGLINTNLEFLFRQAAAELHNDGIAELANILDNLGFETTEARYNVLDQLVLQYIDEHLAAPSYTKDRSNSWARVDYMLEEIPSMGFGFRGAKDHILTNADKYKTVIRKLAPEYGWYGAGDYALHWFNSYEYEKEYLND